MAQSRAAVKRQAAPLVKVDYRFDMTTGTVAGFVIAAFGVAFLIFMTGLVLGVRLNLAVDGEAGPVPAEVEPVAEEVEARSAPALPAAPVIPAKAGIQAGYTDAGRSAAPVIPAKAGIQAGSDRAARFAVSLDPRVRGDDMPNGDDAVGPDAPFVLQAGAFRSPENAENMRIRLSSGGYRPQVLSTPASGGRPLFRVLMGRYASELEAQRAAERFQSETGQAVYVMAARELGS